MTSTLIAGACSNGSESASPSRTGNVSVALSMTGTDFPASYTILVGIRAATASSTAAAVVAGLKPGSYSLTLQVARNCRADGDNPREITVAPGLTTTVTFSVTCVATTGSLRITTRTAGVDLDQNGYALRVEGIAADGKRYLEIWPIDANGTRTISGAPVGDENLTLTGMAVNCDPNDATRRTVSVAPSQTLDVAFTITCGPNTGQLAFVVGAAPGVRHIYLINTSGTGVRRLTDTTFADDADPAWSPDGKRIAFTSARGGNQDLYVTDADGSNAVRLTTDPAADYAPAWSPDGTRIAFVSERAGTPDIFVVQADGQNLVRLTQTSDRDTDPAWSPDGRITFTRQRDKTTTDLYTMSGDGSGAALLTTGAAHAAWSPDGSALAYSILVCPYYGCYPSISVVSKKPLPGSGTFGPGDEPTWSAKGGKIAFTAWECDFYYIECEPSSVRIARIDGSDQITLGLAAGSRPAWRP